MTHQTTLAINSLGACFALAFSTYCLPAHAETWHVVRTWDMPASHKQVKSFSVSIDLDSLKKQANVVSFAWVMSFDTKTIQKENKIGPYLVKYNCDSNQVYTEKRPVWTTPKKGDVLESAFVFACNW